MERQAILGRQVSGVGTLHLAKAKAQTALTHACQAATERTWRESATRAACTRLTDSGGREAAWVGQCPTRPNYVMENDHWRDAVSIRLAVPLPYLALGPSACCCHDRFDRRSGAIGQRGGAGRAPGGVPVHAGAAAGRVVARAGRPDRCVDTVHRAYPTATTPCPV